MVFTFEKSLFSPLAMQIFWTNKVKQIYRAIYTVASPKWEHHMPHVVNVSRYIGSLTVHSKMFS